MNERDMLLNHLDWLNNSVLPGFVRRDDNESVRRTRQQIADIEYRLETDPPRPRPECGWDRSLREHPSHDSDVVLKTTGKHGRIHSAGCFRGVTAPAMATNTQDG